MRVVAVAPRERPHSFDACVAEVISSSTACRRVLDALTESARRGELATDPRWDPTLRALVRLLDALNLPRGLG